MSTTTIRLSEELKARVAQVAERAGTTPHSFILEAIAEKAEREEQRAGFHHEAELRYAGIVASGKTLPWGEMKRYLAQRLSGQASVRPAAKKLVRG